MRVADILAVKGSKVVTISPRDTVQHAVSVMSEHDLGALVVEAEDQPVAGILSERDVVRHLNQGVGVLQAPVASIMTAKVRTCSPEAGVESVLRVMTQHHFRHMPVLAEGVLVGIVSIGDVVSHRLGELETERDQLASFFTR